MKRKTLNSISIILILICYLLIAEHFNIYIFCPIYKFTHLYCPGCGITRMLISILHGNFYQAFRYNPLIFILLPFIIIYWIIDTITYIKYKKNITKPLEPYIWYVLIGIFVLYGILRNVPYFDFLQPTLI